MKAKNKVVYVPPVYEEVQHEVTSVDDKNNPLRTSFHTDVSLLHAYYLYAATKIHLYEKMYLCCSV